MVARAPEAQALPTTAGKGLQSNIEKWKEIGATPWVLGVIQKGLTLRWKDNKPPPPQTNHWIGQAGSVKVEEVMKDQMEKGLWRPVKKGDPVKWVSKAFAIPKGKGEGHRLLVDHSQLSKFLVAPHFKMGSIRDVMALLEQGAYMAKIDLKNAYGQVPLSQEAASYLVATTGNKLWWPLGMPQGTSSAPFVFTSIVKTVWRELRRRGIQVVGYLDDCLLILPRMSLQMAQNQLDIAVKVFTELGFIINKEKTSMKPTREVTFLGMEISTRKWTISWPKEKRLAALKRIEKHLKGLSTPRSLAKLVGTLKAAALAWPTVHLETFTLQKELSQAARKGWDSKMVITTKAYQELRKLHKALKCEKIAPITQGKTQATLTTDAAPSHGWGATLKIGDREWRYAEKWTQQQQGQHSTEVEMRAVLYALLHFEPLLHNTQLLIQSDCAAVVWDLNRKRVRSERLKTLVVKILNLAEKLNSNITSTHIAGIMNTISDQLSRTEMHSGLVLRAEAFAQLQEKLGPCTIDAFATRANAKLPRFISWHPDPEAEAQDFMVQHLSKQELYYVFPPMALLLRALAKIRDEQVKAVIVAPDFPDQVWAPLLRSGALKSINLGTEALVPNQAAAELPKNTQMIAYLWGMLEPSLELHSARVHGQSMTMPSDSGQPSA